MVHNAVQEIVIDNLIKVSTNQIYAGVHWSKRNTLKQDYLWITANPFKKLKPVNNKVDVDFTFYWTGKVLDSDNNGYVSKVLKDCLVHYKILKNDTIEFVGRVSMESMKADKNAKYKGDYCLIQIKERAVNL